MAGLARRDQVKKAPWWHAVDSGAPPGRWPTVLLLSGTMLPSNAAPAALLPSPPTCRTSQSGGCMQRHTWAWTRRLNPDSNRHQHSHPCADGPRPAQKHAGTSLRSTGAQLPVPQQRCSHCAASRPALAGGALLTLGPTQGACAHGLSSRCSRHCLLQARSSTLPLPGLHLPQLRRRAKSWEHLWQAQKGASKPRLPSS